MMHFRWNDYEKKRPPEEGEYLTASALMTRYCYEVLEYVRKGHSFAAGLDQDGELVMETACETGFYRSGDETASAIRSVEYWARIPAPDEDD